MSDRGNPDKPLAAAGSETSAKEREKEQSPQAAAILTHGWQGPGIFIALPEQARIYSQGMGEAHILVGAEHSGGDFWLGQFREDPGFMTLLHLHPQMDEYFFVLQGVLSVFIDDVWHDLKPGTFAVVPRGTAHAQGNTGKEPVHFVGWGRPAGFEKFFIELDEIAKRVPPGPQFGAEIAKLMPKYDTKPLGPPPRRPPSL
jgi:mannose-6-phosphate isomerase-like protein (cupin superfamily)